ncbi:unnamed protein product [Prorocentrum cordatum]|uniref:Uncharacterized protein n=1 Tax=Prorocentrum cordatum TaxID=2364126 RepID=A0ABN9U591_9DINO|nr:unnamed protein product [Polarella glacialis]
MRAGTTITTSRMPKRALSYWTRPATTCWTSPTTMAKPSPPWINHVQAALRGKRLRGIDLSPGGIFALACGRDGHFRLGIEFSPPAEAPPFQTTSGFPAVSEIFQSDGRSNFLPCGHITR